MEGGAWPERLFQRYPGSISRWRLLPLLGRLRRMTTHWVASNHTNPCSPSSRGWNQSHSVGRAVRPARFLRGPPASPGFWRLPLSWAVLAGSCPAPVSASICAWPPWSCVTSSPPKDPVTGSTPTLSQYDLNATNYTYEGLTSEHAHVHRHAGVRTLARSSTHPCSPSKQNRSRPHGCTWAAPAPLAASVQGTWRGDRLCPWPAGQDPLTTALQTDSSLGVALAACGVGAHHHGNKGAPPHCLSAVRAWSSSRNRTPATNPSYVGNCECSGVHAK